MVKVNPQSFSELSYFKDSKTPNSLFNRNTKGVSKLSVIFGLSVKWFKPDVVWIDIPTYWITKETKEDCYDPPVYMNEFNWHVVWEQGLLLLKCYRQVFHSVCRRSRNLRISLCYKTVFDIFTAQGNWMWTSEAYRLCSKLYYTLLLVHYKFASVEMMQFRIQRDSCLILKCLNPSAYLYIDG
jgi:hypothetical protein